MILITALWGIFSTQCLMVKKGSVHEETLISEEQPTHISLAMNTMASDYVFWPQNCHVNLHLNRLNIDHTLKRIIKKFFKCTLLRIKVPKGGSHSSIEEPVLVPQRILQEPFLEPFFSTTKNLL